MNDPTWGDRLSKEEKKVLRSIQESRLLMERVGGGEHILCEKCDTPLRVYPEGSGPYFGLTCERGCTRVHLNFGRL